MALMRLWLSRGLNVLVGAHAKPEFVTEVASQTRGHVGRERVHRLGRTVLVVAGRRTLALPVETSVILPESRVQGAEPLIHIILDTARWCRSGNPARGPAARPLRQRKRRPSGPRMIPSARRT